MLPFEGIRVVDASMVWAGPYMTNILANMGAEVIKVEAIQHVDSWRVAGVARNLDHFWEQSPSFNAVNLNKLGITLDLHRPQGVELFRRLVKLSDIVTENYTPRVMKSFGLDYAALREINPGIIMISMPAHGMTGPWSEHPGYAQSIEQMSGIAQITGRPDGPPQITGWALTDPTAGLYGVSAVMLALLYRQATGEGQYIDLAQTEALTCMMGDAIMDYTMNQRVTPRQGNRHPYMAPHGCYRCRGEDTWMTIAVATDEEWHSLVETIGSPAWATEERFATTLSRWQNQDELDTLVEEWTIRQGHLQAMEVLQKAGVPAGAVLNGCELLADPHLQERRTFHPVSRAIVGTHPYPTPLAATRFSKLPEQEYRPAPLLGEHNELVLGKLLGLSKEEIKKLAEEKIIGDYPVEI